MEQKDLLSKEVKFHKLTENETKSILNPQRPRGNFTQSAEQLKLIRDNTANFISEKKDIELIDLFITSSKDFKGFQKIQDSPASQKAETSNDKKELIQQFNTFYVENSISKEKNKDWILSVNDTIKNIEEKQNSLLTSLIQKIDKITPELKTSSRDLEKALQNSAINQMTQIIKNYKTTLNEWLKKNNDAEAFDDDYKKEKQSLIQQAEDFDLTGIDTYVENIETLIRETFFYKNNCIKNQFIVKRSDES